MAAGQITLFEANLDDLRLLDLTGATIKMALIKSTATPDTTPTGDAVLADIVADEIAAGNGYIAGGATLTTKAITALANGWKFESDDVQWNASGGNLPAWRYGLLYVSGAQWGKTSPLLGIFVGDDTPADIPATLDGNPLTIACPAGGWFASTQS